MSSFGPMKKGNCQQVIILVPNAELLLIIPVVVNNTIRLLISSVVNSTNVVIIIKYQIVVVNNISSNYTKIKFRSFFLGHSPIGNCVITLLDKLTK